MGNKSLIYGFAFGLSLLFSIGYYILLDSAQNSVKVAETTIYFTQVGLYEKQSGADAMMTSLEQLGISSIKRQQDTLTAVICGISQNKKEAKQVHEVLEANQYAFVFKQVKTNDEKIVAAIKRKDYAEAFERIGYESKGTESE